jgi:hypothetical protein
MVRSEMGLGIQYLITVWARILELLLVISLLMDFPIVLPGKAFVASRTEVSFLDFQI